MANTKIISDEIKSRLEFLKTRLNLVAKGNTSKKIYYKIDYCNKNDNDWRVAVKKEEIADFLKDAKNIITRLDADAMQVSFYNYGKIFENEIIRVNNVINPF